MLVNANTSNYFGIFLQYISPLRYLDELAMRRILAGRPEVFQNYVLELLGFTWGVTTCSALIATYMIVCLGLGLFLMTYLSRGT